MKPVADLVDLINVNAHKFVVIIPAAGDSERFRRSSSVFKNNSRNASSERSSGGGGSPRLSSAKTHAVHNYYKANCSAGRNDVEPKQYSIVCHKPLIFHTVAAFLK